MSVLLTSRPLLPSYIVTSTREIGASGRVVKVVRRRLLTVLIVPRTFWEICPCRARTMSGNGSGARDEVDRARERLIEERAHRRRLPVDRPRRTGAGGELRAGAGGLEVGLIDLLRRRQGDHRAGDVGLTWRLGEVDGELRVPGAPGSTLEVDGQLRREAERVAAARLKAIGERCRGVGGNGRWCPGSSGRMRSG